MNKVRLNITLPEELVRQLNKLAGPRGKNNFIAAVLRQRIDDIQKEQMQKLLEEGYKNRKEESLSLAEEFEPIDLEHWDEY